MADNAQDNGQLVEHAGQVYHFPGDMLDHEIAGILDKLPDPTISSDPVGDNLKEIVKQDIGFVPIVGNLVAMHDAYKELQQKNPDIFNLFVAGLGSVIGKGEANTAANIVRNIPDFVKYVPAIKTASGTIIEARNLDHFAHSDAVKQIIETGGKEFIDLTKDWRGFVEQATGKFVQGNDQTFLNHYKEMAGEKEYARSIMVDPNNNYAGPAGEELGALYRNSSEFIRSLLKK